MEKIKRKTTINHKVSEWKLTTVKQSDKKKELLRLMAKIHVECYTMDTGFKTAWFFPEYNGVKGYLGTEKLIFAGINPSYGRFPSKPVKFLYDSLKRYELQNVHVTDIIKSRLSKQQYLRLKSNEELFNKIIGKNINWLKQELKIIDRNLDVRIVGIGNEAKEILEKYFKEKVVDIVLPHYAWVESYSESSRQKKRLRFRSAIRNIKKALIIDLNLKN